jgi:hypothetical protein
VRSTTAPYTESRLTRSVANERVGFPVVEQWYSRLKNRPSRRRRRYRSRSPRHCGCPANSPQTRNTTTTGTPGTARTTVAAEEVGVREAAVAEAADAAAAGERTSPCLVKETSESASESSI